jgi:hypothetical protein
VYELHRVHTFPSSGSTFGRITTCEIGCRTSSLLLGPEIAYRTGRNFGLEFKIKTRTAAAGSLSSACKRRKICPPGKRAASRWAACTAIRAPRGAGSFGVAAERPPRSEEIADAAADYADILIAFGSVDPLTGDTVVSRAGSLVREHGVRGFKVLGQHLAEAARPVRDGAVADLAARHLIDTFSFSRYTKKREDFTFRPEQARFAVILVLPTG